MMTILILQGPNLNLLGKKSTETRDSLTLNKLNRTIRLHVRDKDIKLKIVQTHKEYIALNFIQRNRNQAKGLIVETINLTGLQTAVIYFEQSYSFGTSESQSILKGDNIKNFIGHPIDVTISAIDYIAGLK
jgi:hypothetical protein